MITTIDGYQMTKKGRAGAALAISAIGSFVAMQIAVIGLQLFTPILVDFALSFGPAEYFSLMILCSVLLARLTGDYPRRGILMFCLGAFIGLIGVDPQYSILRFTFGLTELTMGVEFLPNGLTSNNKENGGKLSRT